MTPKALPDAHLDRLRDVGALVVQLTHDVQWRDVRSGLWYPKLLSNYLAHHEQSRRAQDVPGSRSASERAHITQKLTRRAALATAITGAGAASGVTVASLATAETGGLAGPLALPLAGVGMVGELLVRSVIHLRLACELADLYGTPFSPGAERELIAVYALAIGTEMHQTEDDPGRGLVERVVQHHNFGGLGKLVAFSLVGETLLRNIVPFADVPVSSIRNWRLTLEVGRFVQGYVSRRVALDDAIHAVQVRSPESVEPLVQGIWFIFISDGRLTGVETALLAHFLRVHASAADVTSHFVNDEAGWLERLEQLDPDPQTRELVVRALEMAALGEAPVAEAERTILQRVAHTLGVALGDLSPAPEVAAAVAGSEAATAHLMLGLESARSWLNSALHATASAGSALASHMHNSHSAARPQSEASSVPATAATAI